MAVKKVIYSPPDDGSLPYTNVNGIKFKMGVPVTFDEKNKSHYVVQDEHEEVETGDGRILRKNVQKRVWMPDQLKHNPHFIVEGYDRATTVDPVKKAAETAEEYTAEAKLKIAGFKAVSDLMAWWGDEQDNRREFGVSNTELEDDLASAVAQRREVLRLLVPREQAKQPEMAGAAHHPAPQQHQRK